MFTFKQFTVRDSRSAMKVGTDGVLLGAWTDCSSARTIIDAGCGCGLIGLMLAQRSPSARVMGYEIDREACRDAEENIQASPWSDRMEICHGDVLTISKGDTESPLLMVSNPPFFNESLHSPCADRSLARHGDGFGVESLIQLAARLMKSPEDSLAFISPSSRDGEVEFLLALACLDVRRHARVISRAGREPFRSLYQVGRGRPGRQIEESTIVIRDHDNALTTQYKKLTFDFYLDK